MAVAELTVVEAVNQALALEMARDKRVVVFGEDVGRSGGVFRATDGLFARHGANRVIDTPLSEGVIAGAAIGLAMAGWVPVAEIQFLGFAHNGFNQVVDQLARVRYRSAGRFSAQVTIRAPYGGGVRAPEFHTDAFEAHFAHAPGLKVVAPSTPSDAKGLLLASIRDPDPVLYLEPLRGYRQVKGEVPDGDYTVELGKARIAREGTDVTVVAWSASVQLALQAAEAEVAKWLVDVGDRVTEDQPVVEMMTDKASVELPAPGSGVVLEQRAVEGDVVKTGAVLYVLETDTQVGVTQPAQEPAREQSM